jgi:3'-5' exoribonuclease
MRVFVADLAEGDSLEQPMLVRDKQVRTNRNGNAYLMMDLMDRTGSVSARYWNVGEQEARAFEAGDFLDVRGKIQLFQGQLQLIVSNFHRCDPHTLELSDFIPTTPKDVNVLLSDLRASMAKVRDPRLQALAQAFLVDQALVQKLLRAPAGVRNHHAYLGGLLEHVVNLLKVYDRIADLYPELDPDVMRLGILLHDIGKIRVLQYERDFSYSDEGQLIGHLVLGVEILNAKLAEASELLGEPIPEELGNQLKHLIVSHHGSYEFGSPKLPMTPEAIALHHLDNLDAKVHNFNRAIQEDPNAESRWTTYDPKLDRKLFKGSRVRTAPKPKANGTP